MARDLIRPGSHIKIGDIEGEVTEMGLGWDSPAAEDMHSRLMSKINSHTDQVLARASHPSQLPALRERAFRETAEMRRQATEILEKHTNRYAKVK